MPTEAVIEDERILVLNTDTGILEERKIKVGLDNWEHTEITSGAVRGRVGGAQPRPGRRRGGRTGRARRGIASTHSTLGFASCWP